LRKKFYHGDTEGTEKRWGAGRGHHRDTEAQRRRGEEEKGRGEVAEWRSGGVAKRRLRDEMMIGTWVGRA
jgi:hypothetical protein